MNKDKFVGMVQEIVKVTLEKMGFLVSEWHLGKVSSLNADGTLGVFIDGSSYVTPSVPANPNVVFSVGDYVWVHYVNRNPNNLFIPYKRYVNI